MKWRLLLGFIPIGVALHYYGANPIVVFVASMLALIPLARLTEEATDALASYLGMTWGGLLSASLGNAPEIIISLFALRRGLVNLVKASLVGSVVGNLLFALGLSVFAGGVRHGTQRFNKHVASMNGHLLLLSAAGLIIPAVFHFSTPRETREISFEISVILFLIYLASLVDTLVTRKPVIGMKAVEVEVAEPPEPPGGKLGWSRKKAITTLGVVAIGLAIMSEILSSAVEPASKSLGLTAMFTGVFLLATVSNVAQIYNSVNFARANKMDLALGITVASSVQVALVVTPVLMFSSYFMGQGMDLLFSRFEIVAIILAVHVTRQLLQDGRTNWLEGLMLVALYLMLGFGFFYLPEGASSVP
jgi:Ca2+:H+ antiporter